MLASARAQSLAEEGVVGLPENTDISPYDNTSDMPLRLRTKSPGKAGDLPNPTYSPVTQSPNDEKEPKADTQADSLFGDLSDDAALPQDATAPARKTSTARLRDDEAKAKRSGRKETDAKAKPKPGDTLAQEAIDEKVDGDVTTGTVREPRLDTSERLPLDEGSGRETAIEGLKPIVEDDPFAAPGIRAGTFILRPSLEQGLTATSNASSSVGGENAVLSETTLRLNALSDWSRHSASLDAYGIYRRSISGEETEETEAGVDAALNLDLGEELRGRATLGYARKPDSASSAVVIVGTASQPLLQTYSARAGLEKDLVRLRFGITGRVEHLNYGDAELSNGGVLSQADRNATLATLTLRGGYQISPALTPFVEAEIGQRRYDEEVDASGYRRSSDRLGARAGVELDLNEKLTGEVSAGWISEAFDDDRLEDVSGATVNANLVWSPERETRLRLDVATTVEGTTTPGESGSILHDGTLTFERQVRANLTANAAIGAGYRDFTQGGHDTILSAQLGGTWWLNRYAGLTGRLRYEDLRSSLPGRDYDETSVFLGLKLQR